MLNPTGIYQAFHTLLDHTDLFYSPLLSDDVPQPTGMCLLSNEHAHTLLVNSLTSIGHLVPGVHIPISHFEHDHTTYEPTEHTLNLMVLIRHTQTLLLPTDYAYTPHEPVNKAYKPLVPTEHLT